VISFAELATLKTQLEVALERQGELEEENKVMPMLLLLLLLLLLLSLSATIRICTSRVFKGPYRPTERKNRRVRE
jgi:hypothetical protein